MPEWFNYVYNRFRKITRQVDWFWKKRNYITRNAALNLIKEMRQELDDAEQHIGD